jgi:hypothetical protein
MVRLLTIDITEVNQLDFKFEWNLTCVTVLIGWTGQPLASRNKISHFVRDDVPDIGHAIESLRSSVAAICVTDLNVGGVRPSAMRRDMSEWSSSTMPTARLVAPVEDHMVWNYRKRLADIAMRAPGLTNS